MSEPRPVAFQAGARVGPYSVRSLLGVGGMGEVYRAHDPRLGRDVALKVLSGEGARDADRLRRFEQEARATGTLNHPNILVVFDFGVHDATPYVVSELLEGDTLRRRLGQGALAPRKAIDYASQIATGLAAAHEKGIVHRDLKPENLFVTRDGRVKILDFGLAKLLETPPGAGALSRAPTLSEATDVETTPGAVLGTVGYMAPEQVRGQPADHRADVFAFGAILYEMLAGQRAFKGSTPVETLTAILRDEPPELAVSGRPVPAALERIVRRCLEKNPEERFQSARDLAFHLGAVSDESAPPETARLAAPRRRVPRLAAVALGVGIGLGLFGARPLWEKPLPRFTQLAFRRGLVTEARFAPDGGTIVYRASWEGEPADLYSTRADSPEARPLGVHDARLLSISSAGEMALLLGLPGGVAIAGKVGTLARVPLAGGSPREVLEDVQGADWAPDASGFALVRLAGSKWRLEYPQNKLLYETDSLIADPRVSPRGSFVAFLEFAPGDPYNGALVIMDRDGRKRAVSGPWYVPGRPVWGAGEREAWVTGFEGRGVTALRALTPSGTDRLVARFPGTVRILDVFRDGRALMTRSSFYTSILGSTPGDTSERSLSWHDSSNLVDLSADGRTLVFNETFFGGGSNFGVYLRKTDGSPGVRLGDGRGHALSPDGKWVLASVRGTRPELVLLPTGAGEIQHLANDVVGDLHGVSWFPDGRRFLFAGDSPGQGSRVFEQDLQRGSPRALTPEGTDLAFPLVSPDSRRVAAYDLDAGVVLFAPEGGEPKPLFGAEAGEVPIQWSADSRSLYVYKPDEVPAHVFQVDVTGGHRRLWRTIAVADPTGVSNRLTVVMTPDARSYAYSFSRNLAELYLVEGLK